ncbi:MAG TPA: hypothetical protein VH092_39185 [Urbifossiella sp.]|nr:hypothetical protein [Urbifossiella sp.]
MATATRKSQDEEETTDTAGRKHDSRGRFASDDESEGGQGGRSQGQSGIRGGRSSAGGTAQKRVISRAVRVLDEIEARIHELREELEAQGSSGGEEGGSGGGRGQVRNPETDGRLKQNRDGNGEEDGAEEDGNGRGRNGNRR